MKITVEVTQQDIDEGLPGDTCECAVARAIRRALALPEHGDLWVDHVVIALPLDADSPRLRIATPSRAAKFISAIDGGERVEPFSFELEVPSS